MNEMLDIIEISDKLDYKLYVLIEKDFMNNYLFEQLFDNVSIFKAQMFILFDILFNQII